MHKNDEAFECKYYLKVVWTALDS